MFLGYAAITVPCHQTFQRLTFPTIRGFWQRANVVVVALFYDDTFANNSATTFLYTFENGVLANDETGNVSKIIVIEMPFTY